MATFTDAERDTILAALRLWQVQGILDHVGQSRRQLILTIAEENGAALTETEIDALCERINCEPEPEPAPLPPVEDLPLPFTKQGFHLLMAAKVGAWMPRKVTRACDVHYMTRERAEAAAAKARQHPAVDTVEIAPGSPTAATPQNIVEIRRG